MNRAYIFIGSNIDRQKNYLRALRRLSELGEVLAVSSVYDTQPIGESGKGNFYNGAVLLATEYRPRELKQQLRAIENRMERTRTADVNAPRTIDLDLVLYNQIERVENDLKIPDPDIFERAFMALALAELDPDYTLPTDGRTLADMARAIGAHPVGMRLDREMTRAAKQVFEQIHSGEVQHAR